MTKEEAIARIREHKIIHKMDEPRAIYISEALDMAIEALENQKTGHWKYTTHYARPYRVCPFCGCERIDDHSTGWNYCPYCGAELKGENNGNS